MIQADPRAVLTTIDKAGVSAVGQKLLVDTSDLPAAGQRARAFDLEASQKFLENSDGATWYPIAGSSQHSFLTCPVFEVLYEGTRGPGKTDCLLMDFAQDVGMGYGPAWRGILFRQTYKQLGDVIAKTRKWFPLIWPRAKFNQSEHYWTWPDGEVLLLRQFQRESDYWNYHGHEYPWIGWEELCNWHEPSGFLRMQSTCRSTNKAVAKISRIRATTNPYGPGHNWVKHRYRLPAWRSQVIRDSLDADGHPEPPRVAIHGSIWENKILLDADPEYINKIRASARNDAELQAWLYGSWDIVAGGMFDDVWNQKTHIVRPFQVPLSWRIDRSFDWGSSKPFSVGWWAQSDGSDYRDHEGKVRSSVRGDLYRIAEWYGWNGKPNEGTKSLATEVAKGIVEREVMWGLHGRVKPGPADRSIFDVENGMCIADDMERKVRLDDGRELPGPKFEAADKSPGSRKTGWEQMRKALKHSQRPKIGLREEPGLYVFSNCDNFIRTVPVLPRDEKDMDDIDSDAEDHVADETRYRVRAILVGQGGGKTTGGY